MPTSPLQAPDRAEKLFREALRRNSDYTEALVNLSGALKKQGRLEEAEQCCREAVRRRPDLPEGHANLAAVLIEQDRLPEAERCCREALRLRPGFAAAWCNLGDIANRKERFVEAEACCREALRGLPGHAESWLNLGNALKRQNRPDEAIACYHSALKSRPDYAEAHVGLGCCHDDLGQFAVAGECYENALRINPSQVEAHWNRSLLWLLEGRYEEGWQEYEWRRKRKGGERFPHRSWDGSPLDGRTILVHAEQGLGDTLQFARYLPLVEEAGGRVLFECQPLLAPLLGGIAHGSPLPDWDVHVPLMSLARIFGMLPAPKPYVRVEPELVNRWAMRIPPNGGFRVGIVWAGNPQNARDFTRSLRADLLRPLAGIPGVTFYSLQQKGTPTPDWIQTADEPGHEITDRAAAILNLDLVIAVDTMMAHLAGALGAPVWVLLPHVPSDWRWQLDREDSPWYSARLFRQSAPGDWSQVIARVRTALAGESRKVHMTVDGKRSMPSPTRCRDFQTERFRNE